MTQPVVTEVVEVEDLPPISGGSRQITVRWNDGTTSVALRFYPDEILVSEGDLVGRTAEEVRSLVHRRDVEFLRESPSPGDMPFFSS